MFPNDPNEIGDDYEELHDLMNEAMDCPELVLTDWEHGFAESMLDTLSQYGKRTRVSKKQQEIIDRIREKLQD